MSPQTTEAHAPGVQVSCGLGRCRVVGVLNVTPDSFSDGGLYNSQTSALSRGLRLHEQGADVVDVGGESTRPGAQRIPIQEELQRVVPVVSALSRAGLTVSIDTTRAAVARRAVEEGATFINDVSGGLADPEMFATVADLEVEYILCHWRAPSAEMHAHAVYTDVVAEVRDELFQQVAAAERAGVQRERIIVDPGLGFAKRGEHNWRLLRALPHFAQTGHRVLIGASRKRFLGELLRSGGHPRPAAELEPATTAITALAASHGAWAVRVHEPRAAADAIAVSQAWGNPCTEGLEKLTTRPGQPRFC